MPIIDYVCQDRIFSCKEVGSISAEDARDWAKKLKEYAEQTGRPIVALVDALNVTQVSTSALNTFAKASFTHNVLAVMVATNVAVSITAQNIGLLGKRKQTLVFPTLKEAQEHAT